jgi:phage tail-like protein
MARLDPFRGFRFVVEIDGIASAGFSRVKGIARELKVESQREGGVNEYEHKLVTMVTHPIVVLERGLALDDVWKWAQSTADGEVTRKTVYVRLRTEANEPAFAWQIVHALPVKWACADLDANATQVAMESLELAHHGLRRAA